jgi:hypothetical protein
MAQQSARRGWKNQVNARCSKARDSDVVPVRELPYRPAAKLHQQAGQMAATDKCQTSRKRLRFTGRPQMKLRELECRIEAHQSSNSRVGELIPVAIG